MLTSVLHTPIDYVLNHSPHALPHAATNGMYECEMLIFASPVVGSMEKKRSRLLHAC